VAQGPLLKLTSPNLGKVRQLFGISNLRHSNLCYICKGKYNRGKRLDGQWVFGGVERGTGKSFYVPVENRSRDTLLPLIRRYILPGTTIISDCWRAYDALPYVEFTLDVVYLFI
jgi:transposase-like protein